MSTSYRRPLPHASPELGPKGELLRELPVEVIIYNNSTFGLMPHAGSPADRGDAARYVLPKGVAYA